MPPSDFAITTLPRTTTAMPPRKRLGNSCACLKTSAVRKWVRSDACDGFGFSSLFSYGLFIFPSRVGKKQNWALLLEVKSWHLLHMPKFFL